MEKKGRGWNLKSKNNPTKKIKITMNAPIQKIKPIGEPKQKKPDISQFIPIKEIPKFSKDWYDELLNESKYFLADFIKEQCLEMELVKQKYAEQKKYVAALEARILFLNKF